MDLISIYKCLCDVNRMRILNLLSSGPLCVCHLQEILDLGQVKVSKKLRYMKGLGVVDAHRESNWMVYKLPNPTHPLLIKNLQCLQESNGDHPVFRNDLQRRDMVINQILSKGVGCPKIVSKTTKTPDSINHYEKVECC